MLFERGTKKGQNLQSACMYKYNISIIIYNVKSRRLTSNSWVQLWNEQLLTPASAALAMSWRLAPASHKPQKTALEVERERETNTGS